MKKDIQFLKELQEGLKTQNKGKQSSPKFWIIMDYRKVVSVESFGKGDFYVYSELNEYSGGLVELLIGIEEKLLSEMPNEAKTSFGKIGGRISAVEWLRRHWDKDILLFPSREEGYIVGDAMFITKAEAEEHIEVNRHHYSLKAHPYAMTARKALKIKKLFKILETFDWDKISLKED